MRRLLRCVLAFFVCGFVLVWITVGALILRHDGGNARVAARSPPPPRLRRDAAATTALTGAAAPAAPYDAAVRASTALSTSPPEGSADAAPAAPYVAAAAAAAVDEPVRIRLEHEVTAVLAATASPNDAGGGPPLCRRALAFYYPWYGSAAVNGAYSHWNHRYIPPWDAKQKSQFKRFEGVTHTPPLDIASTFYPREGAYSSSNASLIVEHMRQLRSAGIGVLVYTWYPPNMVDDNSGARSEHVAAEGSNALPPFDDILPAVLRAAEAYGIAIALHMEPYHDRTPKSVVRDARYVLRTYGASPALHRVDVRGTYAPLLFVYDSYRFKESDWRDAIATLRPGEGHFVATVVERAHLEAALGAGFAGVYNYFAVHDGFAWGSDLSSWREIGTACAARGAFFIPCVGPGYNDVRLRPWNAKNTRSRVGGRYYAAGWEAALTAARRAHGAVLSVAVTSFNEWHEGTQIEVSQKVPSYEDGGGTALLTATHRYAQQLCAL